MLLHPLSGSTADVFWPLYEEAEPFLPASLPQRTLALAGLAFRSAFYSAERLLFAEDLEKQRIEQGPVFIIGHWRSGTTYLHDLLTLDPQFGYLNLSQMVTPNDLLLSRYFPLIPWLVRLNLPRTRGIDGMPLTIDSPQEEEIALGILSGISYYNCYYFPARFETHYRRAINLSLLSEPERRRFGHAYLTLARKLTRVQNGKPLIFKNPSSTSRIAFLKDLFPHAKFVHIRRNPYEVFASSRSRLPKMIRGFQLQQCGPLDLDRLVLQSYRLLLEQYFAQRSLIPPGDLIEISYEDLTAAPEETLARIYQGTGFSPSPEAQARVRRYLAEHRSYPLHQHHLSPTQIEHIESEWAFAFQEWGYSRPPTLQITHPEPARDTVAA